MLARDDAPGARLTERSAALLEERDGARRAVLRRSEQSDRAIRVVVEIVTVDVLELRTAAREPLNKGGDTGSTTALGMGSALSADRTRPHRA